MAVTKKIIGTLVGGWKVMQSKIILGTQDSHLKTDTSTNVSKVTT